MTGLVLFLLVPDSSVVTLNVETVKNGTSKDRDPRNSSGCGDIVYLADGNNKSQSQRPKTQERAGMPEHLYTCFNLMRLHDDLL